MAAAAILNFRNFKFFNGQNGQEGQTASLCQISSKSLEPRPRYWDFSIFKMVAGVPVKTFGTEFWKFYRKASFFQKTQKFLKYSNVLQR